MPIMHIKECLRNDRINLYICEIVENGMQHSYVKNVVIQNQKKVVDNRNKH